MTTTWVFQGKWPLIPDWTITSPQTVTSGRYYRKLKRVNTGMQSKEREMLAINLGITSLERNKVSQVRRLNTF